MSGRTEQFRAAYRELRIVDQRDFYETRGKEYAAAHRQAASLRNALLILAGIAGLAGQLTSGTGRAGTGVLAAVLATLAGAVTAYEALIGFVQLHKLYGDAALNLARAQIDWDTAPSDNLAADVERVEQIFRTEGGQWGQLLAEHAPRAAPPTVTGGP